MFALVIFDRPDQSPPLSRAIRAALFWGLVPFVGALRNVLSAVEAMRLAADRPAKTEARFLSGIALLDVLATATLVLGALSGGLRAEPADKGAAVAPSDSRTAPAERRSIGILQLTPTDGGLRVDELIDRGPAASGGLRIGDVILAVDGDAVRKPDDLSGELQRPGAHLVRIRRGGGEATVQVVPQRLSAVAQLAPLFRGSRSPIDIRPSTAARELFLVFLAPAALLAAIAIALRKRIPVFLPLGAFFASQLMAVVAGAGAFVLTARTAGLSWGTLLVSQFAMDLALVAVGFFFWSRRERFGIAAPADRERPSSAIQGWTPSELPAREWAKAGALCAVLLLPRVNAIGVYLSHALHGWHLGESPLEHIATMPAAGLVFVIAVAVLLAPIAEEIVFRGILHGWLRRFLPAPAAIALGAVAFALFHLHYGARALGIFVIGCVLGWVRERSGTLRAPMVAHALNNAVATSFLLFGYMFP